jgi:hypothetical protein
MGDRDEYAPLIYRCAEKRPITREFQGIEYDPDGRSVKGIEDHQILESSPVFHIAAFFYGGGAVYIDDGPN